MSVRLSEDRSREPVNFLQGVPKRLNFGGITVADCVTGEKVFVGGPVDLTKWCLFDQSGVKPDGSGSWTRRGYSLHVTFEDGQAVDKLWNVVAVRARQQLRGDLETGSYLNTEYTIVQQGVAPELNYGIERVSAG